MASNRHLGRMLVVQALYEYEFRTEVGDTLVDAAEILARNITRYESSIGDVVFVRALLQGVLDKQAELDTKLQPLAPEWPISQIGRIDRAILRLGLYELLFSADTVPHKVVINEAVELAKAFGSDNSGKFVNGVLGTAYRALVEETDDEKTITSTID